MKRNEKEEGAQEEKSLHPSNLEIQTYSGWDATQVYAMRGGGH
jgi:hypothetical protein